MQGRVNGTEEQCANMVTSFNELVGNIRTSYMMGPNHKKLIVTTVDRYLLILS